MVLVFMAVSALLFLHCCFCIADSALLHRDIRTLGRVPLPACFACALAVLPYNWMSLVPGPL